MATKDDDIKHAERAFLKLPLTKCSDCGIEFFNRPHHPWKRCADCAGALSMNWDDYMAGAAALGGLIGMAEAIRERYRCATCLDFHSGIPGMPCIRCHLQEKILHMMSR